jgi:hypothetical protein
VDKVAHLPELRFALGQPEVDTTSIDNAAHGLEGKAFFIRRIGSDGYQIRHQPTLKKVVSDRRASLDLDSEVKPMMRSIVQKQFEKGASTPIVAFPADSTAISDSPKLTLVLMDPDAEWNGTGPMRTQIAEWTKQRGTSPRLYPGSLVWCLRKPGRDFRDKVENWLAWKRVARDVAEGVLGSDFDRSDKAEIQGKVVDAEEDAQDEVWAAYRFVVLADNREGDGLKVIDLGAGHASTGETLCGRVIAALKSEGLLNESVGAGYLDRNWPPALKESGAWPLTSLRQCFLNGALTRLPDPDTILRRKIVEFVEKGDFGLASVQNADGTYQRVWHNEYIGPDEVNFETNVFLLTKAKAKALKSKSEKPVEQEITPEPTPPPELVPTEEIEEGKQPELATKTRTLRVVGSIPRELWNRLGTKLLPKLGSGEDLKIGVEFSVTVKKELVQSIEADLRQALEDLGILDRVKIEKG